MLAAREEALKTAEDRMAALRAEMLLREENYNKHFRHGGVGERVLDVNVAAAAQSEVMGWMFKGSAGGAVGNTHARGGSGGGVSVGVIGAAGQHAIRSRRTTGEGPSSGGTRASGGGSTHGQGSADSQKGMGGNSGKAQTAPGSLRAPTGSFKLP